MISRLHCAGLMSILALTACASSSNPEPAFKTVLVDPNAVNSVVAPGSQQVFAAGQAKMWSVLGMAYSALGLPVDVQDPASHRMGISNFYHEGGMNGQPVSHSANCGEGPTGPLADSRRVYFSVLTTMKAVDAGHTALQTDVTATAVDVAGETTDRVACGSTGALEALLYDAVSRQLGSK